MKEKVLDIKAESFPWQAKLIGALLLMIAIGTLTNYWWLSTILFIGAVFLFTGHSGTEIDGINKTFREYNSYLFVKFGETKKYNGIEKIFINGSKESQTMYTAHTTSSTTFTHLVYDAYLKFDNGEKIFLTGRKDKNKLIRVLEPVVKRLTVQVVDNTRE
jgi:hypothetical protein